MTHDPSEYVRQLQQLLVSDKKRIGFLFGAGTSFAKKNANSLFVPCISQLTQDIEKTISSCNSKYKHAIGEVKTEIGIDKFTVESLLSNLEQKSQIIGKGKLNKLNKADFDDLIILIKGKIREKVSIHANLKINDLIHVDFAEWILKADRHYPIEIFTTNYDYLLEFALEYKRIPYYDGFTGSFKPFFNSDSVEDMNFLPGQTKLWKIHGSLGWQFDEVSRNVLRRGTEGDELLIYPSTLKYTDSKKQPYTSLGDRLTNFLKQPDSILIVCGYSFGDEHINERITTALRSNISSHVYVLFYDIKHSDYKKIEYLLTEDLIPGKFAIRNNKISVWGCKHAIIGCQFGAWKLKREPDKEDAINIDLYFDADGPTNLNDPLKKEYKGNEIWTGEGALKIANFKFFVEFLQSMIMSNSYIGDPTK